jgi:hypothetical protein
MDIYLYSKRLDLAATTFADLQALIQAIADESNATNAATIARVTGKVGAFVQSDSGQPLTIYSYDDATGTVSSWITDAAQSLAIAIGSPDPTTTEAYTTTTDTTIVGSSRTATLVMNTTALAQALRIALTGRQNATQFYLHLRKTSAAGVTTSVALFPVVVNSGVISSPTNEDNAADVSAAAASAAAAAASAIAAAASASAAAADATATDADAVATAADRVQTGLDRTAAAASAAAAAASASAAAASAVTSDTRADEAETAAAAAAASASAAAASETAAAASATTAAATVAAQYLGGVAGASVPATATAAGYYYRITSAGTSQSKTWAVGDMAIYNGTSGSWTQLAGILPYATAAQARAGTDTTSALNSSTGNERALLGDMLRRIADTLYFDGTTSGSRIFTGLGTPGDGIGAGKLTKFDTIEVPLTNPAAAYGIWTLGPGNSTYDSPTASFSLNLAISAGGSLVVTLSSGDPNYYTRNVAITGFVTTYAGQSLLVGVTWDGATAPIIYINGVAQATTETTGGASPPAWTQAVSDDYVLQGRRGLTEFYKGFLIPGPLVNAVLTAAEMLSTAQTGRLPAWCEAATGSMVAQTSGTLAIGRKYRIISYVASDSFTNVGASSNATGVEFIATGTTPTTWTNSSQLVPLGPLYKQVIQPILVISDRGTNKLAGVVVGGVTPITNKRDWEIQATTSTNGNQQLLAASLFMDSTRHIIDDWCMNTAGTPTVTAGSASAGTQYKASGALTATRNMITLVTRVLASVNLWCGSNDTSSIQHTVRGHIVD